MMKEVLIVTDVDFWIGCSGHRNRISALIEYLAQHIRLTVIFTGPAASRVTDYIKHRYKVNFSVLENKAYLSSSGYGNRLKKFLHEKHFDTIIIEYIHSSYFLNYLLEDVQIILDAHDIISERSDEFKKFNYGGALYELSEEEEFEILGIYDHIMAICQPDYERLVSAFGQNKPLLCPHPAIPVKHNTSAVVKNIIFVGSEYLPNKDAIESFIGTCWSKISKKFDVKLNIYGGVCNVINRSNLKNICYRGYEPDLNKIYNEADVVINPVRFGAGLKIKNIEALSYGVPLITTRHGARGLECYEDAPFLIADTQEDFVNLISLLFGNLEFRKSLSNKSCHFIKGNLSPEKCFEPLLKVISPTVEGS